MANILTQVREGMDVLDSAGDKIGTVETLKMTEEDPDTARVEQMEPDQGLSRNTTFLDDLIDVFRTDDVPEELHQSLLRKGFIRIDADGIFAADRYVLPEQIANVNDDKVNLTVHKDQLIKRS